MVTKLVKNEVMPISSPAFSSSGRDAVNPVEATNPGRIRSAAVSEAPDAFKPEPGERLEDDVGQALEVVEQQRKEADVEDLA